LPPERIILKLKELKEIIDRCLLYSKDTNPDVEIYLNKKEYEIINISQFEIIPTVSINIKKVKEI